MPNTEERYLGRIVGIGQTIKGDNAVLYRLSSQHYPNRQLVVANSTIKVVPADGHDYLLDGERNIFYNAIVSVRRHFIVGNGSHTDFIAEAVENDVPVQKAIETVLATLGYERNEEKTPRIVGVVPAHGNIGWLGIVREDALIVRQIELEPRLLKYISTSVAIEPDRYATDLAATNAQDAAKALIEGHIFNRFTDPVASAVVVCHYPNVDIAIYKREKTES